MAVVAESRVLAEHLARERSELAARIETEFKVPAEGHLWPRVYWLACVVVNPEEGWVTPTDHELRQIRSYIEFKARSFYREHFADEVLDAALPLCAGHNTVIFAQRPEVSGNGYEASRGWGYRRMTWETASWPHAYGGVRSAKSLPDHPLSVVEVMDHVETIVGAPSEKWIAWKTEHAELFN